MFDVEVTTLPYRGNQEQLIQRDRVKEDALRRLIRQMGLKVTGQRMSILKALTQPGPVHVTAQELFERVSPQHPDIGFATVYRFLRALTQHNFVTELRMGGAPARYELTPHRHHDHLMCTQCGQIVEFENEQIEKLQLEVAQKNSFQLTGHVLELYGLCPACQQQQQEKKKGRG